MQRETASIFDMRTSLTIDPSRWPYTATGEAAPVNAPKDDGRGEGPHDEPGCAGKSSADDTPEGASL
jgi:hypothetical protein